MLLDNGQLSEAVEKCIYAAAAEFQPRLQKTLLSVRLIRTIIVDVYRIRCFLHHIFICFKTILYEVLF